MLYLELVPCRKLCMSKTTHSITIHRGQCVCCWENRLTEYIGFDFKWNWTAPIPMEYSLSSSSSRSVGQITWILTGCIASSIMQYECQAKIQARKCGSDVRPIFELRYYCYHCNYDTIVHSLCPIITLHYKRKIIINIYRSDHLVHQTQPVEIRFRFQTHLCTLLFISIYRYTDRCRSFSSIFHSIAIHWIGADLNLY